MPTDGALSFSHHVPRAHPDSSVGQGDRALLVIRQILLGQVTTVREDLTSKLPCGVEPLVGCLKVAGVLKPVHCRPEGTESASENRLSLGRRTLEFD